MRKTRADGKGIKDVGGGRRGRGNIEPLRGIKPKQRRDIEDVVVGGERLQDILFSTSVAIYTSKTSGDYGATFISDNVTRIVGYEAREFVEVSDFWIARIHPEDKERILGELPRLFERGTYLYEYRFLHKNGTYVWVRDEMKLVRDAAGRPVEIIGCWIDITERKRAEEELARERNLLRTLIDNIPDEIYVKDAESRFILYNRAVAEHRVATGAEELIGKTDFDLYPRQEAQHCYEQEQQIMRLGKPMNNFLQEGCDQAGNEIIGLTTKMPLRDTRGEVVGVVGISRNVTEEKKAERALAEERNLLRALIDNTPDEVYVKDTEGRFVLCNEAVARRLGKQAADVIGKTDFDFFDRELAEAFFAEEQEVLRTGSALLNKETFGVDGWGKCGWALATKTPLRDANGRITGIIGINRDITERKQAADEMRDMAKFPSENPYPVLRIHRDGTVLYANKASEGLLKARSSGMGQPAPAEWHRLVKKALSSGQVIREETEHDGRVFAFRAAPIAESDYVNFYGVDITERKKMQEALRESEEKFKTLADESFDSIVIHDGQRIIEVNKAFGRLWGYDPKEAVGLKIDKFFAPECWEDAKKRIQSGYDRPYEADTIRKDGTRFQVEIAGHSIIYKGKPARIATTRDITERKRAEEALRETTQTLEVVIQASPLPIFAVDRERIVKTWNPAAERTFGWSAQEAIGRQYPAIPKEKMDEADALFLRALESGLTEVETLRQRKDGSLMDVSISAAPLRDSRGNISGVMAVITDITERKKAEERVKAERQRLYDVLETLPVMVCLLTPDYHVTFANRRFREKFGEDNGRPCFDYIFGRKGPCEFCEAYNVLKTGKPHHWEYTGPDGCSIIDIYNFPFTDTDGSPLILEMDIDITERKQAEQALKKSNQLLRDTGEMAKVGGWELDLSTKEVFCTEETCRIHGLEPGHKLFLEEALNFYAPESRLALETVLKKAAETGEPYDIESLFIPSGSKDKIWVRSLGRAVYSGDKIVKLAGTFQNIDKYKRAEEELVRLNKVMGAIADVNQDIFRIKDRDELLKSVCGRIAAYAYKMVWIGFCDEKSKEIVPAAQAGFEEGYLTSVKITCNDSEHGMGPTGTAVKTGKPNVMRFIATDPRYELWREEALKRGYRSSAAVPIFREGKVIGALNVYSDEEDAFGSEEVKLLEELTNDISTGLRGINEGVRRRRAEEKLLSYQKGLRKLASQLTLAEERERRRIAGELHDQVSQSLAFAKIKLDALRAGATSKKPDEVLSEVGESLDKVIGDMRSLMFDLSCPVLYELGFEAAVAEWLEEQVEKEHGIKTEFEDDGEMKPLTDDVRVLLFRDVRELLINAVKHAHADKIKVSIRRVGEQIEVRVEDDGVGFDPAEATAMATRRSQLGLFSIRERLEEFGGRIEIESAPGRGCRVTIRAPLMRQKG
jgi:PAS domain S-box-containing protein